MAETIVRTGRWSVESRTDNQTRYYRRRPSTRTLTTRVAALASAAALALGAGLSWQLANGADPALGPKAQAAQQSGPSRIVKTVVVKRIQESGSAGSAGSAGGSSPVSSTSAPVASPSPAPVTSSTS
jgi:hypothetical protein